MKTLQRRYREAAAEDSHALAFKTRQERAEALDQFRATGDRSYRKEAVLDDRFARRFADHADESMGKAAAHDALIASGRGASPALGFAGHVPVAAQMRPGEADMAAAASDAHAKHTLSSGLETAEHLGKAALATVGGVAESISNLASAVSERVASGVHDFIHGASPVPTNAFAATAGSLASAHERAADGEAVTGVVQTALGLGVTGLGIATHMPVSGVLGGGSLLGFGAEHIRQASSEISAAHALREHSARVSATLDQRDAASAIPAIAATHAAAKLAPKAPGNGVDHGRGFQNKTNRDAAQAARKAKGH